MSHGQSGVSPRAVLPVRPHAYPCPLSFTPVIGGGTDWPATLNPRHTASLVQIRARGIDVVAATNRIPGRLPLSEDLARQAWRMASESNKMSYDSVVRQGALKLRGESEALLARIFAMIDASAHALEKEPKYALRLEVFRLGGTPNVHGPSAAAAIIKHAIRKVVWTPGKTHLHVKALADALSGLVQQYPDPQFICVSSIARRTASALLSLNAKLADHPPSITELGPAEIQIRTLVAARAAISAVAVSAAGPGCTKIVDVDRSKANIGFLREPVYPGIPHIRQPAIALPRHLVGAMILALTASLGIRALEIPHIARKDIQFSFDEERGYCFALLVREVTTSSSNVTRILEADGWLGAALTQLFRDYMFLLDPLYSDPVYCRSTSAQWALFPPGTDALAAQQTKRPQKRKSKRSRTARGVQLVSNPQFDKARNSSVRPFAMADNSRTAALDWPASLVHHRFKVKAARMRSVAAQSVFLGVTEAANKLGRAATMQVDAAEC